MYYPEELVEEIRDKNDIVDVISGYVALKRQGSSYMGLCPFHNEKSASFSVAPHKRMFYCFGCHKGGDVFTFICEYENFTYPEAIKFLGERVGIKMPEVEYSPEAKSMQNKKQTLMDINKEAAKYFYSLLRNKPGEIGLDYFKKRQLSEETMKKFGLGFASARTNDLLGYLKNKGYSDDLLKESGLFIYNEKYGFMDKFINRVIFPIQDVQGRVIGFGGRVMGDEKADENGHKIAKYLNSPETIIFDKSRNLYGLNLARTSRKDYFILCEGYMDVIAMHQAGFSEAVASLGTAFTSGQALLIKRYVHSLYFAYDSDSAGVNAAVRAIGILREVGLSGKVINMRPYKDPDEFMKNLGTEEFQKRIDEAENGFIFEIRVLKDEFDMKDPDSKTRFQREVAIKLLQFQEQAERENYIEAVSRTFDINPDSLHKLVASEALKNTTVTKRREIQNGLEEKKKHQEDENSKPQRLLLTWLADDASIYKRIKKYITVEDFTDELYRSVAELLFQQIEEGGINHSEILGKYQDVELQQRVAQLFNTKLEAIETDEEKNIALHDIVMGVKKNSFNEMYARTGSDPSVLIKVIESKKLLEELQRISGI